METKNENYMMFEGIKYNLTKEDIKTIKQTQLSSITQANKEFKPTKWVQVFNRCKNKIGYKLRVDGSIKAVTFNKDMEFTFLTEWTAKAFFILKKLIDYRRAYNGNWKIDWADPKQKKYSIIVRDCRLFITECTTKTTSMFIFKTRSLAQAFLDNFEKDIKYVYDSLYAN